MTTLLDDAAIRTIDVLEIGDPLAPVPTRLTGGATVLVRRSLVPRLARAGELLPRGVRLRVLEGHRPAQEQLAIYGRYDESLRLRHPDWPDDVRRRAVSRFVSPIEVAPHVAGAAVDLTLVGPLGRELDMGTAVDATPEESENACFLDAEHIGARARRNRRFLADAMGAAGFVNYPTEWWHWSFGDKYWAYTTGAAYALYGPVRVPVPA
jgi:zinc D-Ala-D-Ala dipeptidase